MRYRFLPAVLLILGTVACPRSSAARASWCQASRPESTQARDSARIADLALRALAQRQDSVVCYRVQHFRRDSAGAVLTLLPEVLPKFAHVDLLGGGGEVRVRGDSAIVLVRYR